MTKKLIFVFCLLLASVFATEAFSSEQPEFFVQLGHSATVHSIAFSPDGKYAASGGMDNNVKIWNAETGREVRTLQGHTSYIYFVTFSPDGRFLVSTSHDSTVRLWEVASGREMRRYSTAYTNFAIFNSEGDLLFNSFGEIVIWNIHSGTSRKLKATYGGGDILAATFIDQGKHLLVAKPSGFIVVDPQTDKTVRSFGIKFASTSENIPIAFSADGRYALMGKFNRLILWDTETGKEIKPFEGTMGNVNAVAFSPDGRHLLSGGSNDTLKLWETATGREVRSIFHYKYSRYGARYGVCSVAFSPDGKRALAGYKNGAIKLWDVFREDAVIGGVEKNSVAAKATLAEGDAILTVDKKRIRSWHEFADSVAASPGKEIRVAVLRNNQEFSFRMTPTTVKTKDAQGKEMSIGVAGIIQGGVCVRNLEGNKSSISSSSLSPDGHQMAAAHDNGTISVWDMQAGRELRSFKPYKHETSVVFSPKEQFFLSTGDNNVTVWDTAKTAPVISFKNDSISSVGRALSYSPDGKYAVAGGRDVVTLYDMEALREIRTMPLKTFVKAVAISPAARYLAAGGSMDVKLWDAQTGADIRTMRHGSFVYSLDFTPDGKYLLSGAQIYSDQNTLKLWELSTGREMRNFGQYKKSVYAAKFSPDGKMLLTGGDELILWTVAGGRVLKTFSGHHNTIWSVAFLPDGKSILSAGDDGTVRIWSLDTGKETAQFVSFADGEWIVITPEGYFNASPGGAKYLNVRVGNNVYSVDNFYEKFFNPVYVASVLQGKKVEPVADIRKGILSPPDVRITSPSPGSQFSADILTVTVFAKDTGGGIDEIRLYHNGKAIGDEKRAVKVVSRSSDIIREYTVSLMDGVNTFRATGFSKDRTESNPYELVVKLTAPSKDVSLYVIAVGINKYRNPALNLNYAEPDARGIANFFKEQGKGLFKNVAVRAIYNEQATKGNIVSQLGQLQNIQPQDAVLIYLAGHGENINDKWYFIPHELTYPEREEDVKAKGLSSDELSGYMKNIRAQKILMLIDACKSGAVLVAFRGFEDRKALSQLSRSTGVHIVAASTKDQFAAEVKELGHGVFTYTLLEGLNGKAAGKGEAVTVRKLMGYVEEQLPEITKKYKQEAQYPVVDSRGMDFPLVKAK